MPEASPPSTPRRPARGRLPRAADGRRLKRWITGMLLFVAALVVVNALIGRRGLFELREVKREHAQATALLADTRQRNAVLRERARRLREDPRAIEDAARRDLGLMRPDEYVFIVRDAPPAPAERPRGEPAK